MMACHGEGQHGLQQFTCGVQARREHQERRRKRESRIAACAENGAILLYSRLRQDVPERGDQGNVRIFVRANKLIRLILGLEYFLPGTSAVVVCVKARRRERRKRLGFGLEVG